MPGMTEQPVKQAKIAKESSVFSDIVFISILFWARKIC
jgi:hypothetical protein